MNNPSTLNYLTTGMVKGFILTGRFTKQDLAVKLSMSRPTLDKRLEDHKWNTLQMNAVKVLSK